MDNTGLDPPIVPESLWWPRSRWRQVAGLLVAVGTPALMTSLVLRGSVHDLPGVGYMACILLASLVGRLAAAVLAVTVSAALVNYFVYHPRGIVGITDANALDFVTFILVGLLIAVAMTGVQRAKVVAQRAWREAGIAQRRLAIISEASRTLASSFDLPANATHVCQQVVQGADWDYMIVVSQTGSGIHYLAEAAKRPGHTSGPQADAQQPQTSGPEQSALVEAIAAVGDAGPVRLPLAGRKGRLGPWPYRSGLIVGLPGTNEPSALVLLHDRKAHRYNAPDITFAAELASRIAVAIDNASRYQRQVHIAHTLQRSMLPRSLPAIPQVKVHASYTAGADTEVGGDFYDVFPTTDGSWLVVVGDVCGKGPEAATVMSTTRATVRALALHEHSPKRLLTLLNEALLAQLTDGRFVTVCCAVIQPTPSGEATVVLTRAGHPAPVLHRSGQPAELAPGPSGTLLGVFPNVELTETTLHVGPGDTLTFYTDGIESRERSSEELALRLVGANQFAASDEIAARFIDAVPETRTGKTDDLVVVTFAFGTTADAASTPGRLGVAATR